MDQLYFNKRTILWYLTFTGNLISTIIITNINIAIVGMVKHDVRNNSDDTRNYDEYDDDNNKRTFSWNESQQSVLLGSFSWLVWLTLIPGGILSTKYGAKIIFGGANLIMSVLSLLIPVCAYEGFGILIVIRVLQGMVDGLGNSCIHTITSKWIPEHERCWFMATYVGGKSMALVLSYPLFGWIIEVSSWENIFYISGLLGVVWCLMWYCFMYETPAKHTGISSHERAYIESTLEHIITDVECETPWKEILTSSQVWLNLILCFTNYFALSFLQIYIPMYYTIIHGLDVQSSAILSGSTHIFRLLFAVGFSFYFDHLLKFRILSRTNIRKISTSLCTIGTGIPLFITGYCGYNFTPAAILITTAIATTGFCNSSFFSTMVDIAPNFAGIIMAVASTFSSFAVLLLSSFVGWVVGDEQSIDDWKIIFITTACLTIIPGILFIMFGSAEIQKWNGAKREKEINEQSPLLLEK